MTLYCISLCRVSPSSSLNRRGGGGGGSQRTLTTTTTSSSGDYVSATEDAGGSARPVPVNELRHQRNKEQFDRLFGKVKRDPNLRNLHNHSPVIGGGVSLATILQDNGGRKQQQANGDENGNEMQRQMQSPAAPPTVGPVQSTLVSQFENIIIEFAV